MALPDANIMGEGVDDDGANFDLKFKFADITESLTELYGFLSFQGIKETVRFNVDGGMLDHCFIKGGGTGFDTDSDVIGECQLDGQVDQHRRTFHFTAKYKTSQISFKGQTNDDLTVFRGVCKDPQQPDAVGHFHLKRQEFKRASVRVMFREQVWKDIN